MKDELNTDRLDDLALAILDEGGNIPEEHVEALKKNAALRKKCRELLECRAFIKAAACEPDVEGLLREFHAAHAARPSYVRKLAVVLAAAAALFAGVFFILRYQHVTLPATMPETAAIGSHGQQAQQSDAHKPANATATGSRAISVSDYRKALTESAAVKKVVANVPEGQSSCVSLPDGSKVYLHPGSRLLYPETFIGDKRYVMLEGEAYFQVAKDRTKPFIVQSGHLTTTVLGTEFNVKGNEVTLITGSVRVRNLNSRASLTITPGEQASLTGDGFKVAEVDTQPYVYWRDGYLYYDNMEIADIVKRIGDIYNLPVTFTDTRALHQRLRFIAERDKGVDAVLERLNKMQKVHAYRKDGRIFVE